MTGPIVWDEKKKVDTKRITIDPITRLRSLEDRIFLDDRRCAEGVLSDPGKRLREILLGRKSRS